MNYDCLVSRLTDVVCTPVVNHLGKQILTQVQLESLADKESLSVE